MAYNFEYLRLESGHTIFSLWSDAIIYLFFRRALYMSAAEALCIKNTSIDQIGLGHLILKHEMFCFEKTAFKTFLLEYLIF